MCDWTPERGGGREMAATHSTFKKLQAAQAPSESCRNLTLSWQIWSEDDLLGLTTNELGRETTQDSGYITGCVLQAKYNKHSLHDRMKYNISPGGGGILWRGPAGGDGSGRHPSTRGSSLCRSPSHVRIRTGSQGAAPARLEVTSSFHYMMHSVRALIACSHQVCSD